MRALILAVFLLAATPAYAQWGVQTESTVVTGQEVYAVTAIGATANGAAFYFPRDARAMLLELSATHNGGTTPTLNIKLQHSSDGTTWYDVPDAAFTQVTTTSTKEEMHINRTIIKLRPRGRVVATLGGTSPDYDATVTLYTDSE